MSNIASVNHPPFPQTPAGSRGRRRSIPLLEELAAVKDQLIQKYAKDRALIESKFDSWVDETLTRNLQNKKNSGWWGRFTPYENKADGKKIFEDIEATYLKFKGHLSNEPKESILDKIFNPKRIEYDKKMCSYGKEKMDFFKVKEAKFDDKFLGDHCNPAEFDLLHLLARNYISYLRGNDEISLPFQDREGRRFTVEYVVEEIPLWFGLSAYGFKPKNPSEVKIAPPFLMVPGTKIYLADLASGASILSNLDPRGVGYTAFKSGQENIKNWLHEATNGGQQKAIACGYSQGGAIAINCVVHLHQYFSKSYAFSSPGVGFLTKWKWDVLSKVGNAPIILNFDNPEDWVPRLGQAKIGNTYAIKLRNNGPERSVGPVEAHKVHFSEDHDIFEVKVEQLLPKVQIAGALILFTVGWALLFLKRVVVGYSKASYLHYLTGPLEFVVYEMVILKIGAIWRKIYPLVAKPENVGHRPLVLSAT